MLVQIRLPIDCHECGDRARAMIARHGAYQAVLLWDWGACTACTIARQNVFRDLGRRLAYERELRFLEALAGPVSIYAPEGFRV